MWSFLKDKTSLAEEQGCRSEGRHSLRPRVFETIVLMHTCKDRAARCSWLLMAILRIRQLMHQPQGRVTQQVSVLQNAWTHIIAHQKHCAQTWPASPRNCWAFYIRLDNILFSSEQCTPWPNRAEPAVRVLKATLLFFAHN